MEYTIAKLFLECRDEHQLFQLRMEIMRNLIILCSRQESGKPRKKMQQSPSQDESSKAIQTLNDLSVPDEQLLLRSTFYCLISAISATRIASSEELGTQDRGNEGDIEEEENGDEDDDEDEDEDDSEGETIGSEDWSLEESDDDSQERRDLGDFIVEDDWGKEESDVDYTESDEEDDDSSDDSTVPGNAESWSGGDSSESFQVHEVYGPASVKQVCFNASFCFYGSNRSLAGRVANRFEKDSVCDYVICDLAEWV
jgi:hypothetical protein